MRIYIIRKSTHSIEITEQFIQHNYATKLDRHAWDKRLTNDPKHDKDNHSQSLKYPCRISQLEMQTRHKKVPLVRSNDLWKHQRDIHINARFIALLLNINLSRPSDAYLRQ